MGRNSQIKRFNATRAGQPLDLFESHASKLPVIMELLSSPWIVRASDLVRRDGSAAPKRVADEVVVEWNAERACPSSFMRDGRRYRVDAVLQVWASERTWWDPRRRISRRYWRVLARGGVYDLVFDRASGVWRLTGIHD